MEMDVCIFGLTEMDGNEVFGFYLTEMDRDKDSISVTDGNGIYVSVCFCQAHFLFSVLPPSPVVCTAACDSGDQPARASPMNTSSLSINRLKTRGKVPNSVPSATT